MNKGLDQYFSLICYVMVMNLACWTVSPLGINPLVPSPVLTRRMWQLNAQVCTVIYIIIGSLYRL